MDGVALSLDDFKDNLFGMGENFNNICRSCFYCGC